MTTLSAILGAFGLAGAAGLNAYLPLLVIAILGRTGVLHLGGSFELLTATWAIALLSVLLAVELIVDKIPGADHVNDVVQTFVRPTAGAILFAANTGVIALASCRPYRARPPRRVHRPRNEGRGATRAQREHARSERARSEHRRGHRVPRCIVRGGIRPATDFRGRCPLRRRRHLGHFAAPQDTCATARGRPHCLGRLVGRFFGAIAHAANGLDVLPAIPELLTKPLHVRIHRARCDVRVDAPHVAEEDAAGLNAVFP